MTQTQARTALLASQAVLLVASLGYSATKVSQLPDRVPSHWNAAGQIDGYGSKLLNLWVIPGLQATILGLSLLVFVLLRAFRARVSLLGFFVLSFALALVCTVLHFMVLQSTIQAVSRA